MRGHGLCPHLYADDTQIYGFCRPSASLELQSTITNCVDDVARWMRSNRLQLNTAKTDILWSATSRRSHQLPQLPLRVGTDEVTPASVVRDLGIYIDSDVSMRSHVMKTVSAWFADLRQLQSVRQSVPRSVFRILLQLLVTPLVLTRLDHGNATLAGIPLYLLKQLQSVMNSTDRLVFSSSGYEQSSTSPQSSVNYGTLVEGGGADWLQAGSPCIQLQVSARCSTAVPRRRTMPASRHRSSLSSAFRLGTQIVRRTRMSTVGDRAFSVAAPRTCNSLPQHVTSAPSLAIFRTRSRLKTHLFKRCFPWLHRSLVVPQKWHVITDTLIVFVTYLLTLSGTAEAWNQLEGHFYRNARCLSVSQASSQIKVEDTTIVSIWYLKRKHFCFAQHFNCYFHFEEYLNSRLFIFVVISWNFISFHQALNKTQ